METFKQTHCICTLQAIFYALKHFRFISYHRQTIIGVFFESSKSGLCCHHWGWAFLRPSHWSSHFNRHHQDAAHLGGLTGKNTGFVQRIHWTLLCPQTLQSWIHIWVDRSWHHNDLTTQDSSSHLSSELSFLYVLLFSFWQHALSCRMGRGCIYNYIGILLLCRL